MSPWPLAWNLFSHWSHCSSRGLGHSLIEICSISSRMQDRTSGPVKAMYIEIRPCGNNTRIQEHSGLSINKHWGWEAKCLVQNASSITFIFKFLFVFLVQCSIHFLMLFLLIYCDYESCKTLVIWCKYFFIVFLIFSLMQWILTNAGFKLLSNDFFIFSCDIFIFLF